MNNVGPIVFVGCIATMVGWLAIQQHDEPEVRATVSGEPAATAEVEPPAPPLLDPDGLEPPGGTGGAAAVLDDEPLEDEEPTNPTAGTKLPDGSAPPKLDGEGPKSVQFGVILVQYKGAQGAKTSARSREDAESLAQEIATLAKDDFAAAVKKGDKGSTANAGRMYRGIMEPAPEFVLFGLGEGEVGKPVDTPRGYLVMKRLK